MPKLGDVRERVSVIQTYHKRGVGAQPTAAEGFGGVGTKLPEGIVDFLKNKLLHFKCHWIIFRACLQPFERTRFLPLESQLKKLNCSLLVLLTI